MNQRRHKKLSRRLFTAILMGDAGGVRAALRSGADPAGADADGTTPSTRRP